MSGAGSEPDVARFALHGDQPAEPVLGRLVERGLHDELKGTAYVVIDGVDGRTHHLVFSDLEMTADAKPGAIVELRAYDDDAGRKHLSLATRSDLAIEAQISAAGATWLDRQLLAKVSALTGGGLGAEVRQAMDERSSSRRTGSGSKARSAGHLRARSHQHPAPARARRDRLQTIGRHGARPSSIWEGEHVSGIYRQRVTLASGRFAMIDDSLGFQLVPWRGAGAAIGSAGVRHVDPRRRDRLVLPPQTRARPVVLS